MLIEFRERKRGVNKQMWYSVLWGSRRALALSSMSVCVRMCVCVRAAMCAFTYACAMEMETEEGIKMGLFIDSLQAKI